MIPISPSKPTVFIQEACLRHQYIRSKDLSNIVERPERLRAVNIGISAALSRLESLSSTDNSKHKAAEVENGADDLVAALDKLNIGNPSEKTSISLPTTMIKSNASVVLLDNPAVKFVHGDIEGDIYLENLTQWAKQSRELIAQGESEIPSNLSQGDLYRMSYLIHYSLD